ncbi:MAG: type II toxin-antitoxin system VapC family toxin, partial [Thaumarchaeota archaeon]
MEKAVVDASVVVKWFVSEENSAEALALRDAF